MSNTPSSVNSALAAQSTAQQSQQAGAEDAGATAKESKTAQDNIPYLERIWDEIRKHPNFTNLLEDQLDSTAEFKENLFKNQQIQKLFAQGFIIISAQNSSNRAKDEFAALYKLQDNSIIRLWYRIRNGKNKEDQFIEPCVRTPYKDESGSVKTEHMDSIDGSWPDLNSLCENLPGRIERENESLKLAEQTTAKSSDVKTGGESKASQEARDAAAQDTKKRGDTPAAQTGIPRLNFGEMTGSAQTTTGQQTGQSENKRQADNSGIAKIEDQIRAAGNFHTDFFSQYEWLTPQLEKVKTNLFNPGSQSSVLRLLAMMSPAILEARDKRGEFLSEECVDRHYSIFFRSGRDKVVEILCRIPAEKPFIEPWKKIVYSRTQDNKAERLETEITQPAQYTTMQDLFKNERKTLFEDKELYLLQKPEPTRRVGSRRDAAVPTGAPSNVPTSWSLYSNPDSMGQVHPWTNDPRDFPRILGSVSTQFGRLVDQIMRRNEYYPNFLDCHADNQGKREKSGKELFTGRCQPHLKKHQFVIVRTANLYNNLANDALGNCYYSLFFKTTDTQVVEFFCLINGKADTIECLAKHVYSDVQNKITIVRHSYTAAPMSDFNNFLQNVILPRLAQHRTETKSSSEVETKSRENKVEEKSKQEGSKQSVAPRPSLSMQIRSLCSFSPTIWFLEDDIQLFVKQLFQKAIQERFDKPEMKKCIIRGYQEKGRVDGHFDGIIFFHKQRDGKVIAVNAVIDDARRTIEARMVFQFSSDSQGAMYSVHLNPEAESRTYTTWEDFVSGEKLPADVLTSIIASAPLAQPGVSSSTAQGADTKERKDGKDGKDSKDGNDVTKPSLGQTSLTNAAGSGTSVTSNSSARDFNFHGKELVERGSDLAGLSKVGAWAFQAGHTSGSNASPALTAMRRQIILQRPFATQFSFNRQTSSSILVDRFSSWNTALEFRSKQGEEGYLIVEAYNNAGKFDNHYSVLRIFGNNQIKEFLCVTTATSISGIKEILHTLNQDRVISVVTDAPTDPYEDLELFLAIEVVSKFPASASTESNASAHAATNPMYSSSSVAASISSHSIIPSSSVQRARGFNPDEYLLKPAVYAVAVDADGEEEVIAQGSAPYAFGATNTAASTTASTSSSTSSGVFLSSTANSMNNTSASVGSAAVMGSAAVNSGSSASATENFQSTSLSSPQAKQPSPQ